MLSINTNLSSLIAQRSMRSSTQLLNQAIERMTTGYKINHSRDNAANYSIATNMDTKIGAYNVAEDNAAMGLDMITTANESLSLIQDKLTRLRDLQEQASNGTYGEQSLKAINSEANALVDEINRLYEMAEYNGIKLFGVDGATPAQASEPIATFGLARTISMPETNATGFMKSIDVQDTSGLTTLASQASNTDLTDGTYSITTADELLQLASMTVDGYISENDIFVFGDNIDMTGTGFSYIGGNNKPFFSGTIDGNGYELQLPDSASLVYELSGTVKNLSISGNSGYAQDGRGLVARKSTSTSKIQNVVVNNVTTSINDRDRYATGIVGINEGLIENCFSIIDVADEQSLGSRNVSLAYLNYGTIKNCSSVASGDVFMLVADNWGTVDTCYGIFNNVANPEVISAEYGSSTNSYVTDVSGSVTSSTIDWDGTKFTYSLVKPTYSAGGGGTGGGSDPVDPDVGGGGGTAGSPPSYAPGSIMLQVGVGSSWSSQVGVDLSFTLNGIDDLRGIGIDKVTDYFTILDDMLSTVAAKQVTYGAAQNRLESALDEIETQRTNLVSSRSTLRDADIADVSSQYIKQQILQQASATLMATANQAPALALQLI